MPSVVGFKLEIPQSERALHATLSLSFGTISCEAGLQKCQQNLMRLIFACDQARNFCPSAAPNPNPPEGQTNSRRSFSLAKSRPATSTAGGTREIQHSSMSVLKPHNSAPDVKISPAQYQSKCVHTFLSLAESRRVSEIYNSGFVRTLLCVLKQIGIGPRAGNEVSFIFDVMFEPHKIHGQACFFEKRFKASFTLNIHFVIITFLTKNTN